MSYRKRLRKRVYVLLSDKRATSVIGLRRSLSEATHTRDESTAYDDRRFYDLNTRNEKQEVAIDLLEVKYKLALERIAELEDNNAE